MIYRVVFFACIIMAPFGALFAQVQVITVQDLIPVAVGQYVDYNEYDTATAGSAGVKSHASYTITGIDKSAVISVLDSIGGGDPSGIHNLSYFFTTAGDLQAYADSALIDYLIPASIAAGVTNVPNTWIDYFKLSAGLNTSYPMMVLDSKVTASGTAVTVTVTISGTYKGIDTVTASGLTYDSAYRFDINALVNMSALGGLVHGSFKSTQSNWVVRGIGVIKTNAPIADTTIAGNPVSTVGRETEMTSYGVSAPASVTQQQASDTGTIRIYPNPVSDQTTLSFDRPATSIYLYNPVGQMVRSFEVTSHTGDALIWVKDLPNGVYLARARFADGSSVSSEMVIQH